MMFLRPLARRATGLLWLSNAAVAVGHEVRRLALVWIAVELIGESAAYVAALQAATLLVLSLWGGAIVDRWDHRWAMVTADIGRSLVALALIGVILDGALQPWHLFAVSVLLSTLSTLYDPALQVAVTGAAGSIDALQTLNGLMDGAKRLARILVPGLVAAMAAGLPVHHLMTLSASAHAVSAVAVFGARAALAPTPRSVIAPIAGRSMWTELGGAIAAARAHALMSYAIVGIAVRTACWVSVFYLCLPLRLLTDLPGGVGAFSLVIAVFGAGNLLGSACAVRFRRRPPGLTTALGRLLMGHGFVGIAWAPNIGVMLAAGVVAAIGGPLGDLPSLGLLYSDFSAEVVGKIVGLRSLADAIGMLAAPALIAVFGLSGTMGLWAVVLTLVPLHGGFDRLVVCGS